MIAAVDARDIGAPADAEGTTRSGGHVARVVLIAILVTVIAALGFLVVARPFGIGTVITHGVSMGDAVPNGSLAVARDTAEEDVAVGDIIVIDAAATKIHRVIAVEEQDGERVVQTQGDATGSPDPGFYALHTAHAPRRRGRAASRLRGCLRDFADRLAGLDRRAVGLAARELPSQRVGSRRRRGPMSGRLSSGLLAVLLGAALLLAVAPTNALGLFTGSRAVAANSISTNTLAPPTGLAASVSGTNVTLTWTATPSSFASGYDVLRSTISGGPYTQIAQVTPRTTLTYVDSTVTAGTTYYYVLRAYYQSWLSTSTAQVSATPCTPSVVQSAVGGGTAGSFSATFPAVPGSGRLLVAVAATRTAGALTTPAGWTPAIVETGGTGPSQAIFYKIAAAF